MALLRCNEAQVALIAEFICKYSHIKSSFSLRSISVKKNIRLLNCQNNQ